MQRFFDDYYLADRGRFDVALVKDGREICYTQGETVVEGAGWVNCPADNDAIFRFCDYYDISVIEWKNRKQGEELR